MRAASMNEGANKERTAILSKLRREMKMVDQSKTLGKQLYSELKKLLHWIEDRSERYNKRKGGLGRR
jgi:hypothetical protein